MTSEPRKVIAAGAAREFPGQPPEHLARIGERSCPVGWELELAEIGGELWGVCWECCNGYRISGGVLMYIPVLPYGRVPRTASPPLAEVWGRANAAVADAIGRGLRYSEATLDEIQPGLGRIESGGVTEVAGGYTGSVDWSSVAAALTDEPWPPAPG
jgi:hypothetical protein